MKKTKLEDLIIGYGEIGRALYKLFKRNVEVNNKIPQDLLKSNIIHLPHIYDKYNDKYSDYSKIKKARFMHVCYPYNQYFEITLVNYIAKINPYAVIIHSTIPIGTTRRLNTSLIRNRIIFHSPVRGVHPHLKIAFTTFIKYLGVDPRTSKNVIKNVKKHLKQLGMKVKVLKSEETELGKLLSTFQYGRDILLADELFKICRKFKVDYNNVILHFNKTYNEGYANLNLSKYSRSLLFPDIKKGFGGHCIVPNADLLKKAGVSNYYVNKIIKTGQKSKKRH